MPEPIIDQPNQQMRAYLPCAFLRTLRYYYQRLRGAQIVPGAVLFAQVSLLRHVRKISIAQDVVLKTGVHLCPCNPSAAISIGARTTVGFYSMLYATSEIIIGEDCMIAPFVYIVDSNHARKKGKPMNQQANISAPIHIGNDVWIGTHSVILAGSVINDGAIIGAGSVVRGVVPANAIYSGIPAQKVGERQ